MRNISIHQLIVIVFMGILLFSDFSKIIKNIKNLIRTNKILKNLKKK